uniref:hypothetical protein n=1 Tax=Catenuloplanes japonicus TaxID=33876 RepID=UPI000526148B
NTVSTISGQQTSRSVILASGLGQPVHKFTIDMELDAEIYRDGDQTPRKTYSTDAQSTQTATMDTWVPDMRVSDVRPPDRDPLGAPRPVSTNDRTKLKNGPLLPNLPGITGVRGSAALNQAFGKSTRDIFKGRTAEWLIGQNPGNDATISAQSRRVFTSHPRLIAAIDAMLRGSHSTEQPFETGALSDPEGRHELQAYVSDIPEVVIPRPDAVTTMYVEDGNQLTDSNELRRKQDTQRTHAGGAGVSTSYGTGGFQERFGRGHQESEGESRLGTDYRVNIADGKTYTLSVPVTFVGKSTFARSGTRWSTPGRRTTRAPGRPARWTPRSGRSSATRESSSAA